MPSIFISYRRQDAEVFAGRLYDRLVQEFGEDHVFMDVDTLKPGDDYIKAIERKLRHIDVFLAVIGEQWVTVTGDRGSRRLEDERDLLRLEVATALKRSVRVIPVLVGGATMPRESELPADIANVTRLHAFELASGRFRADVQLLVNSLRGVERAPTQRGKVTHQWSWIILLAVVQPLLFVVSGLLLHLRAETGQDLYPSAKRIFFGGLLVGATLAVLSKRARNGPGVFQASAQFAFAAVAALALPAIDEVAARTSAWGLYVAAMLFGVTAWWTIRSVSVASLSRDLVVNSGPATTLAGDVSEVDQRQEHSDSRTPASREKSVVAPIHKSGRWKRISSYVLVSLDLLGLFLLTSAAVAMWIDRPRRASPNETFLIASLTTGPWMLGLMLFGWIAEARLCWMLGVATLIPFLVLTFAGNIDASTPLALATLAGIAVAAFAVETLRRLRKSSDHHIVR
jgi:TIR domain